MNEMCFWSKVEIHIYRWRSVFHEFKCYIPSKKGKVVEKGGSHSFDLGGVGFGNYVTLE